jgi:Fe(3+) dicitrate transport protein
MLAKKLLFIYFLISFIGYQCIAQSFEISGKVTSVEQEPLVSVKVFLKNSIYITTTDSKGLYKISGIPAGSYDLLVFTEGKTTFEKHIELNQDLVENVVLENLTVNLNEVSVVSQTYQGNGLKRLRAVEGTAIYASKKNEVIVLKDVKGNVAANTARHIFGKVPGVNIWESDGGGIQLGIGVRGLNPSRSTDFNMRQNGYDISADAIGYNESYYTPPAQALERIEIVRGAASLQYGPHFGGMINFVFKKAPEDRKVQVESIQTGGSYGFFGSYNAVGGTIGKLKYYSFYQYRRGDGWRENSNFDVHTAYASMGYKFSKKLSVSSEYTFMHYLTKQPGGLTTAQFNDDPRKSYRDRNWFKLNWNLFSLSIDYMITSNTKLNIRNFGLFGERQALGFLGPINRPDNVNNQDGEPGYRDLLWDNYLNVGNETRLLHHYYLFGKTSTFLAGFRIYKGLTHREQGFANESNKPDFHYLDKNNLESNFDFPGTNAAFFAENIFEISPKFSVTPGLRIEYIKTSSDGYYFNKVDGLRKNESKSSTRSFPFFGIGASYKPTEEVEFYGNISQNYKAINFNDLRVNNPNKIVDENLKDESGFNIDLGSRGNLRGIFNYDISLFQLNYHNRISTVSVTYDDGTIINNYSVIKNAGDSKAIGVESFGEADVLAVMRGDTSRTKLFFFSNLTLMEAKYTSGIFKGNQMEYAPNLIWRAGLTFKYRNFWSTLQYSYTSEHYSDASNAETHPTEVSGKVPSYYILDISSGYKYKYFTLSAGINNLTNNMYFTRRALSYPGPGIIPSDGRNFYVSLGVKF